MTLETTMVEAWGGIANPFQRNWGQRSDSEWLQALISACDGEIVDDVRFPTLPSAELQRSIQGTSHEVSVRGSMTFFHFVRKVSEQFGRPITGETTLLDFGTGWGRMMRPFMRDMNLASIYGVEPSPSWCRVARLCNPYVNIVQSDYMPPLPFKDELFDHVIAYSVFTHLPEPMFDVWMKEIARVTKTGGIVVFTHLGDGLMRTLRAYPQPLPDDGTIHFWHRILLRALDQQPDALSRYNQEEFLFLPTHGNNTYGDSFMRAGLIRRKVDGLFRIAESNDNALAQDVIVMLRA